ncbi:MAG: LPS assembly lipoprotein LptE [Akkermansiaceae bacterium]
MTKYLLILCIFLTSCAGYQLGGAKPEKLSHVNKLYVPLFSNSTLLPRVEAYATNSTVDAITRDGTYQVTNADKADAILEGHVSEITYSQVSSSRDDSQITEELGMDITIIWKLVDSTDPMKILHQGESRGKTLFFAGSNLHIARTNALPDALRSASESLVSKLADGF